MKGEWKPDKQLIEFEKEMVRKNTEQIVTGSDILSLMGVKI